MSKLKFSSKPYIIKSNKYSTIEFVLIFPCSYEKKDIFNSMMLKQLLLNSSSKYKTEEKYLKEYQKNMIIKQSLSINKYNKNLYFEFHLLVPDPQKVKNYDLESAFEFFIDTIYHPNIENNEFDNYCFKREKEYLKKYILNSLKDIKTKAYQSFLNIVDDKGTLKDNIYNNMNLIENTNPRNLYKYYQKNILNNTPIIIIYGNVNESINNLINKYINISNNEIIIDKNYDSFLKPFNEMKIIEESSEYSQSVLYIAYKVKNMKQKDKIYLDIMEDIISYGSNRLLFKELRLNKKLVYSCNVKNKKRSGMLVISSYINNKSKDDTIRGVERVIKLLKDKENLCEYMDKLIGDIKCELIRSKDSRIKPLNDFIIEKFKLNLTVDKLLKKYKEIKIDEILEFLDRLQLDTVYFLRGEIND